MTALRYLSELEMIAGKKNRLKLYKDHCDKILFEFALILAKG